MKRITFLTLILTLLVIGNAYAGWYVISADTNTAVSYVYYLPDADDLDSRNEFAIESDYIVPVNEAEYRSGKIKAKMKSSEEANKKKDDDEEEAEMALIYHRIFTNAYKELKAEGKAFKQMHKHIDPEDL